MQGVADFSFLWEHKEFDLRITDADGKRLRIAYPKDEGVKSCPKSAFCALKWYFFAPKMVYFGVFLEDFAKKRKKLSCWVLVR